MAMNDDSMRSVSMMSDANLIQAHRSGDQSAFPELMARHHNSVMGFLVNRVGSDAEDLFQETWTRVGTKLHTYNETGSFRAWVFQIARRLVIDHHRHTGARVRLVLPSEPKTPSGVDHRQPDQQLAAVQIADAFESTLAQMPFQMAEVIRLRLIEGTPFQEIAQRQGVPLNTALARMHRGLKKIRATLAERQLIDVEKSK
jgi:RNA polymerase sigma-70 factor (ECF subfamily)